MRDENSFPNRILLGQLISNGDCLYATAVAQQIKRDFPGCHLTWAVSSLCRSTLEENPFIDQIWEIPLAGWSDEFLRKNWSYFEDEALKRYEQGFYDFIFFTQIYPGNPHHFEGTVRPGIFLGYPGKITVPLQPSLVLRTEEVERVNSFAERHRLRDFEQVILFECSAKSGQTHITPEFALKAAETITNKSAGRHAVILSSHQAVPGHGEGIIDASVLTLREMAELTKHCSLLIGCSSGISTIATSTWAKPLPMIQVLTNRCAMFASLAHDYLYFGLPTSHVLEMFDADVERLVNCFDSFLHKGWTQTRDLYHENPKIAFTYYLDFAGSILLNARDYYGFCVSLRHTVDRYGWHPDLEEALRQVAERILPESVMNGAGSSDELLSQLRGPSRILSAIAIGISGYDPPSIRMGTCLLSLRRNKQELERILEATGGFIRDDPEFPQLITALTDSAPKEKVAILQSMDPGKKWPRVARVLALMQQAEYAEARQELTQWKQIARSWSSQLEEILGDLNWMHGYHSEALASYQAALRSRPYHSSLQRKIDRLATRHSGNRAIRRPEVRLEDLGLVFYPAESIDNGSVKILTRCQLRTAGSFGLEIAYLSTPAHQPEAWSLVDGKDLSKREDDLSFMSSKESPSCKKFIDTAIDWAHRKGKKWVAVARLDHIITTPFLRELQYQLTRLPRALIVDDRDVAISSDGTVRSVAETRLLTPGLILIRIDWWKRNSWRFSGYRLEEINWMRLYAIKILKLTKAAYISDPELRILTIQSQEETKESVRKPASVRRGDLGTEARLRLFKSLCGRASVDPSYDEARVQRLIDHFFRKNILQVLFTRSPG
jgi:hypothetical protein